MSSVFTSGGGGKRILWLDIAKGIGIILMVLGHTGLPSMINNWIFSFHMPLFFIISGILFNPSRYVSSIKFIQKRVLTLLLPYLIFSSIVLFFSNEKVTDWILSGWNTGIALWFLPVLFLSEIYWPKGDCPWRADAAA